jgi:hypothetical protein
MTMGEAFCCRGSSNLRIRSRYIVLINHSFICVQVVYLFCFNILICWPAFLDLICGPVKLTCLSRSYLRAGKAEVGWV